MLLGIFIVVIGIVFILLVFLLGIFYVISCVVGYLCFGLGLGIYVIFFIDIVILNVLLDKVGVVLGIYKMVLLFGGVFGVVISGVVYVGVVVVISIYIGVMIVFWVNVLMGIMVFIVILFVIFNDDKCVKDVK